MGPNLTRLFDNTKLGTNSDVIAASEELRDLFKRHGEALIAALESILAADERGQGLPYAEAMQRAAKLLAQLEAEAQP